MTSRDLADSKLIDKLIRNKRSFALYRLPGEERPHFLMRRDGAVRRVESVEALNGQRGFVIAPFRASDSSPIVLIEPDLFALEEVDGEWEREMTSVASPKEPPGNSSDYNDRYNQFTAALREERFEKLVLSRALRLERNADFSPATAFYKACEQYIHSYVYLCYTPQTGLWFGSTPEQLLSGGAEGWSTVALAGTQSLQAGELPQTWDDKNREEQAHVSSYIRRQLQRLEIHPTENGPYPAYAGALAHLKTDFRFALTTHTTLGSLLNLLHPTPAVCGLPKEEAYRFIVQNEGYDRRYYTGFIGWIDPAGQTDLYVNLRCMQITDHHLTLYAGGGLLPSSEREDEWQETEKKLKTMLALVGGS